MSNEWVKDDSWFLERSLSATQGGVMITDALVPDDPIVWVNRAFERITGYEAEEVLGRNPRFLQAGDSDQPALDDLRASRLGHNEDIEWSGVLRNYKRDGTLFYNELVAAAVRDEEGRATHHVWFVTDVTERVRAEERLRFQAELLDAVGQAVVAVDLSGRITYWNRAAEELYGWPAEEALGRPAPEVMVSEEQMERAGEIWSELSAGRSWSGEFVVRRRDGTSFPAMVADTPVFDERGNLVGIIGVSADLTERKRAEEALRKSEANLAQAQRLARLGSWEWDVRAGKMAWSDEAYRVLGFAPRGVPPTFESFFGAVHPDDREMLQNKVEAALRKGEPYDLEHRLLLPDGEVRVVHCRGEVELDERGEPLRIVGTVHDVTGRVRAEEALRESERRFKQLFENSVDALFVIHPKTREIVDGNWEACRSLGYPREKLLALRLEDFALEVLSEGEKRRRGADTPWRRALSGELATYIGFHENVHRRKDGTTFPVEVGVGSIEYAGRRMILASCRDATQRKRAEEALRLRDRAIAESKDGVVITGPGEQDHPMVYVNRGFERMSGYAAEELLGRNCRMLQGPERDQPALRGLRAALREGREWSGLLHNRRKGGTPFWNELSVSPVRGEGGSVTHFVGVMNDATERKELEERLEHQAFHDGLTGLPNRALLMDRLGHALARAERDGRHIAVLFLDLDNFKYVNDSLGHDAGDELLAAAAVRLKGCVRPGDTVARLGGDEFAVLLEGVARDAGEATLVARRAVEALGEPFDLKGREVFSGASVGVALGEAGRDRPEDLLRKADLALYEAKREGKARHTVFDPETERRSMRRLELENGLRRALERDEIVVRYQPVVSLKAGQIVGFEALLRWEHPERGLVYPDEFVPLAEENGLIVPVGRWVLGETCRQVEEWQRRYPSDPPLIVGVNLSAAQLRDPDLVAEVEGILEGTGLDPERLTLEVTESVLVEDAERHVDALRGLKDLGVRLAIDDFGTSYSSLSYLKRLPAGLLKLDGSFVAGVGEGAEEDEVLLSGVVGIAHGLGLEVVAEGVETPEQAARLRELGCDLAQGNHFSGPLTDEEAAALLRSDLRRG